MAAKVLIVLTSNDAMGSTDKKTGLWLDEFAAPFYRMKVFALRTRSHSLLTVFVKNRSR